MKKETQLTALDFYAQGLENLQYNPLEKNGYDNAKQRLFAEAKEIEHAQQQLLKMGSHPYTENEAIEIKNVLINEQDGLSPINF